MLTARVFVNDCRHPQSEPPTVYLGKWASWSWLPGLPPDPDCQDCQDCFQNSYQNGPLDPDYLDCLDSPDFFQNSYNKANWKKGQNLLNTLNPHDDRPDITLEFSTFLTPESMKTSSQMICSSHFSITHLSLTSVRQIFSEIKQWIFSVRVDIWIKTKMMNPIISFFTITELCHFLNSLVSNHFLDWGLSGR